MRHEEASKRPAAKWLDGNVNQKIDELIGKKPVQAGAKPKASRAKTSAAAKAQVGKASVAKKKGAPKAPATRKPAAAKKQPAPKPASTKPKPSSKAKAVPAKAPAKKAAAGITTPAGTTKSPTAKPRTGSKKLPTSKATKLAKPASKNAQGSRQTPATPPPLKIETQPANGPWDEAQLRLAYETYESDVKAAEALGIHNIHFGGWRALRGLPSKATGATSSESIPSEKAILAALDEHETIAAAARSINVSDRIIRAYCLLIGTPKGPEKQDALPAPAGTPDSYSAPARVTDPKEEHARLVAYQRATTDAEAAKQVGLATETFRAWRHVRKLPAKVAKKVEHPAGTPETYSPPKKLQDAEVERLRLEAYLATDSDRDGAQKVGISKSAFNLWRLNRRLPSKETPNDVAVAPPKGPTSSPKPDATPRPNVAPKVDFTKFLPEGKWDEVLLRAAYDRHETDANAAKVLGITGAAFGGWRAYRGLPSKYNGTRPGAVPKDPDIQSALNTSDGVTDAARHLGTSYAVVKAYMQVHGIVKERSRPTGLAKLSPTPAPPPHHTPDPSNLKLGPGRWDETKIRAAYERTDSDIAAANLLGISAPLFAGWRLYRGISAKTAKRPPHPPPSDDNIAAALRQAGSVSGAARRLKVDTRLLKAYLEIHGGPVTVAARRGAKPAPQRSKGTDEAPKVLDKAGYLAERGLITDGDKAFMYHRLPQYVPGHRTNKELLGTLRIQDGRVLVERAIDGEILSLSAAAKQVFNRYKLGGARESAAGGEHWGTLNQSYAQWADELLAAEQTTKPEADDEPAAVDSVPKTDTPLVKHGWHWRRIGAGMTATKFDMGIPEAHLNFSPAEVREWFDSALVPAEEASLEPVIDQGLIGTLDELVEIEEELSEDSLSQNGGPVESSPVKTAKVVPSQEPPKPVAVPGSPSADSSMRPAWRRDSSEAPSTPAWRTSSGARTNGVDLASMLGEKKRLVRKHLPKFGGNCELCRKDGFRDGLHYLNHVCSFHKRANVSAYIGEGLRAMVAIADGKLAEELSVNDVIVRAARLPPIVTCPECREDIGQRPHLWADHFKQEHADEIANVVSQFANKLIPGLLSN